MQLATHRPLWGLIPLLPTQALWKPLPLNAPVAQKAHLVPWPGPGELRAWKLPSPLDWSHLLPTSKMQGSLSSGVARYLRGKCQDLPLALFFTSHRPPHLHLRHAKGALPVGPRRCGLEGLDIQEASPRGDVVCQSRQSLEALLTSPGPEGGPTPLFPHPGGAWLEEMLRSRLFAGIRRVGAHYPESLLKILPGFWGLAA